MGFHQQSPNVPSKAVGENVEIHLLSWQHLAAQCSAKGLSLYKMRPKHHNFFHIGQDCVRTRLNPKVQSCWNDESFLGYLKRIGLKCHQANVMQRMMQRYILFLSLRWHDARCN